MADNNLSSRPARYHSHRERSPPEPTQPEGDVTRTRSRYRRRADSSARPTPPSDTNTTPSNPQLPEVPARYRSTHRQANTQHPKSSSRQNSEQAVRDLPSERIAAAPEKTSQSKDIRPQDPPDRRNLRAARSQHPTRSSATPRAQQRSHDGPPKSNEIRATKSMSALPKQEAGGRGFCWGMFKKKASDAADQIPSLPQTTSPPTHSKTLRDAGAANPRTDAPISAVNAGDRRVLIECGASKTMFPVTPSTTPIDLVKSAALCMSERIDVKSSILLEYFGAVGVHRPLRRYEHVRDVMNSWDNDMQNSLLLVDPGVGTFETALSLAGVPKERPEEQSWLLYYSQKVGKWEKRLVILREDGQILCQKESNKSKDSVNICHLSDFDIYTPTQEKLKKKIKPPRKHCLAIKSQQKTSMFESTENFVHFFSSADKISADSFHDAVQTWRSWYLVHVLGEGSNSDPQTTNEHKVRQAGQAIGHRVKNSTDSNYQLGSFKPLDLDANVFHEQVKDQRQPVSMNSPTFTHPANRFESNVQLERRTSSARSYGVSQPTPLLKEDEPLANAVQRLSIDRHERTSLSNDAGGEFKASGLLGRSYSQRQRDLSDKLETGQKPFTKGPSLINEAFNVHAVDPNVKSSTNPVRRQSSLRNQGNIVTSTQTIHSQNSHSKDRGSGGVERAASRIREKPRPLLDFSHEQTELPKQLAKGHGYQPDKVGVGRLIENATSPTNVGFASERRDYDEAGAGHAPYLPRSTPAVASMTVSPSDIVFTQNSLLAGAQMSDSRAQHASDRLLNDGRPMVDLRTKGTFVNGSLLDSVERDQAPAAPIIDREFR